MKRNAAKVNAGLVLLLAVIAASVGIYFFVRKPAEGGGRDVQPRDLTTVTGPIGSEKSDLLSDPAVVKILAERHGLVVVAEKAGSLDIVQDPKRTAGKDFAWPSSQVALEIFKSKGQPSLKTEVIFNSPIVLYSWEKVCQGLEASGVVKESAGVRVLDFPKLVALVKDAKPWSAIGLSELYGDISIHTTDPNHSNSGMMFCGLLANMLNNGQVVTDEKVAAVVEPTRNFFGQLGMMEHRSADLFSQFVTQGIGSNPIIAGYENQLVEFILAHPEHANTIRDQIRILYPKPTVWSNHPLIAFTSEGVRFLDAMKDPEIQRLAWEKHGFRSGMPGVQNDPKVLKVGGIPKNIENVIQMPRPTVMKRLLQAVGQG